MAQSVKILDVRPAIIKFKKGMNMRSSPSITASRIGSVGNTQYYKMYYWAIVSPDEFWVGLCPDKSRWVCWLKGKESFIQDILMPDAELDLSSYRAVQIPC